MLLLAALLSAVVPGVGRADSVDDVVARAVASIPHPAQLSDFEPIAHLSPQSQDKSYICWSFSTASFFESEMQRLGMEPVRLSVTFPVYYTFLRKAKRFVETKGESRFAPGDLFVSVLDSVRENGVVPAEVYGNKVQGKDTFDQFKLYDELDQLMASVKEAGRWDEADVLARVTTLLNRHLGAPPDSFTWRGRQYTPLTFKRDAVRLPWDRYLLVTSFQYAPFGSYTELRVPDNWSHNSRFFNVPLDEFYESFRGAVRDGYSAGIDFDFSEPSYQRTHRYAIVPPEDVRASDISQATREYRFANGSTTDDHLVQAVGYRNIGGEDWFLIKDSWETAWEKDSLPGYMFFHGSYVKLKVLAYLVHEDAVPSIRDQVARQP